MDNYKIFITDSLRDYDKNIKEQNKLLKYAVYIEYIISDDNTENDKIIFYDENHKEILRADFEIIATYNSTFSLWT
jgi:hypothetical protein